MSRLIDVAAILDGMAKTLAGTEQGEACAFAVRIMRERESAAPALHPDTEIVDWLEKNVLFNGKEHSGQVRWIFHTPEREPAKETRGNMLQFTTLRDALRAALDTARKQETA